MLYKLPDLSFDYSALEPHIDAKTMEIHHSKHHNAYTNNFNKALEDNAIETESLEKLFMNISRLPIAVKNNGGGYFNHSLFWEVMSPSGGGAPQGKILSAIENSFNSFEEFQNLFNQAATTQFGSGWAWLIVDENKNLKVTNTSNQDNPLMDTSAIKGVPILCLDVWEHAYYLKYQNKRPDYINAWWNVVNWQAVERKFELIN